MTRAEELDVYCAMRNLEGIEGRSKQFSFRLRETEHAALVVVSQARGIGISDVLRDAVWRQFDAMALSTASCGRYSRHYFEYVLDVCRELECQDKWSLPLEELGKWYRELLIILALFKVDPKLDLRGRVNEHMREIPDELRRVIDREFGGGLNHEGTKARRARREERSEGYG